MRDRVLRDVWLNTDFFAEQVTYRPVSGEDRTITVHINESPEIDSDDLDLMVRDRLRILASRDTADENDKGYILYPAHGDQILRSVEKDSLQMPYVYSGESDGVRPEKWRLIFDRIRPKSQGPSR